MATTNPHTILYGARKALADIDRALVEIGAGAASERLGRVFEQLVFSRTEFNGWWAPPGTFEAFAKDYEKVANKIYKRISYLDTARFALLPKLQKKIDKADGKHLKIPYLYSLTHEAINKVRRLGEYKDRGAPDAACPPPYRLTNTVALPCPPPSNS